VLPPVEAASSWWDRRPVSRRYQSTYRDATGTSHDAPRRTTMNMGTEQAAVKSRVPGSSPGATTPACAQNDQPLTEAPAFVSVGAGAVARRLRRDRSAPTSMPVATAVPVAARRPNIKEDAFDPSRASVTSVACRAHFGSGFSASSCRLRAGWRCRGRRVSASTAASNSGAARRERSATAR
jgi:hypothetical protein